jgi:lysophospholipase
MKLYPTRNNRLPPNAQVHQLTTADGIHLRAMTAGTAQGRGTILILNGRAEFMERYFETMNDLVARKFFVAAIDWRGQGGSDRITGDHASGHVISFADYDEDLRTAMEQLVRAHCPGPYYVLAHSTGGHVALRNVLKETWFSKAVITAPLMELQYGLWPRFVARAMSFVMAQIKLSWLPLPGRSREPFLLSKFEGNPLTSSEKRWMRDRHTLEEHRPLGIGAPTYGWLNAAMESINQLKSNDVEKGPKCPVLMVLAGRERVVDNRAAVQFAKRVPGVSLIFVEDANHEILMERDVIRKSFLAGLENYLDGENAVLS